MIGKLKHLTRTAAAIAAFVTGMAFIPASSQATQPQLCTQHGELVAQLDGKYGEKVTASGFDGAGNFVQVFSSKNGTWTIAISVPGGLTCVIAAGDDWQEEKKPLPKAEVAS
ncbi:MAG: hypothetical protein JJ959_16470 [Nisaea sp.]|uniref:hypothetical protein n=1 Tax=Nisaea sp. TaxID=2024842 RepID=UPI001AFF7AA0|nr:hypothetical protein [Nisaea sp.]MBO6562141.1 hypothetical protein [Nisaea sp.]